MAASVTGQKTSTVDVNPTHSASTLNTIWAIPVESLTVAQVIFLQECLSQRAGGEDPNKVVGSLF